MVDAAGAASRFIYVNGVTGADMAGLSLAAKKLES